jgi:hypothetical protein
MCDLIRDFVSNLFKFNKEREGVLAVGRSLNRRRWFQKKDFAAPYQEMLGRQVAQGYLGMHGPKALKSRF